MSFDTPLVLRLRERIDSLSDELERMQEIIDGLVWIAKKNGLDRDPYVIKAVKARGGETRNNKRQSVKVRPITHHK